MQELYAPMIERDLSGISAAVRRLRHDHSSDDLFVAIARFAILAFAPSQHGKHALLACLAAHELREEAGNRFDELLTECAIYAASSRQPWSEPPMMDPPAPAADQRRDSAELRLAVEAKDRLRAERWLAARLDDDDLSRDLFDVASGDLDDLGHKLIITTASWKLAGLLGVRGRYAALRPAVVELTAYQGSADDSERHASLDAAALLDRLLDATVAARGSLDSAHAVFLLDSALEAVRLSGDSRSELRVRDHLTRSLAPTPDFDELPAAPLSIPIYRLARDYGQSLKSHAVAKRLRLRFPAASVDRLLAATHHNLVHGPSFEE